MIGIVTNPPLRPKKGYTIVLKNGVYLYEAAELPVEPITLLAETTVDHEYRISLLKLGVTP
jgi:hypothetical protein